MTRPAPIIAAITLFVAALISATSARAQALDTFGVLAGSTITSSGATIINGNVGLSPGSAITGFPPGIVTAPYETYNTDAVASQAKNDLVTAYNLLASRPTTQDLTGFDLGGQVLTPGVYSFSDSAQLTGTLMLDAEGDPNAVFIFNIGSSLTTATDSVVALINSANGANVFFVVGSSATIGTTTEFVGTIMALTSISLGTNANIDCGAALARNGAVTLLGNTITVPGAPTAPAECEIVSVPAGTFEADLPSMATSSETAVAAAIDAFIAGGGTLPLSFSLLLLLSEEELAAAFAQLSGQAATGVAPAATQAMDSLLAMLLNPYDEDRVGSFGDERDEPDTIRALGYGPEDSEPHGTGTALATFGTQPVPRHWGVWAAVYGGHNTTAGDLSLGSNDRSTQTAGLAIGLDYRVTPDTKLGFAISGGGTSYSLSDGFGSGHSDMLQAAVYTRTNFDAAYVAAALAYALHDFTTDRFLTVAGTDHLRAEFIGHNFAGQIEGGYRIATPDLHGTPGEGSITPYAGLRVQSLHTPAYSESAVSGSSIFALAYDARSATTVRSELGARFERNMPIQDGATLTLRSRLAWAHDYSSNTDVTAMFVALPGSSFTVNGATPGADSLLLSAGAEVKFNSGLSVAGLFDSAFAEGSQTYTGTARVRFAW